MEQPPPRGERPYRWVLFGATGFTGRLVAEYLLAQAPADAPWAIAGRSRGKLEALRDELADRWPRARELPLLVADSGDRSSLDALAAAADVVATTVGPYATYGSELVGACVAAGTHYCDLTGEVHFIRRMIDAHHEAARERGARIVHCCGFDSIPSDLGTLMITDALEARGATPEAVRFYAGESRGGFSGGTIASMLALLDEAKRDREVRRILGHPYALNPEGARQGPDGSDQTGVRFDEALGMWTAPFVMAAINTRVVRRSIALRGAPFGDGFRYSEVMSTGKGPAGLARATAIAAGLGGFLAATSVGPLRRQLEKRLPAPGEGPSEAARQAGYFVIRLIGRGRGPDGQRVEVRGKVAGNQDPGYGETAKMLGESAMCLALDGDRLPAAPGGGGVLTPATAMGTTLLDRLRAAGMTFEVEDA
jgi:short subunit dehydrogenase-like uncharacterized protein